MDKKLTEKVDKLLERFFNDVKDQKDVNISISKSKEFLEELFGISNELMEKQDFDALSEFLETVQEKIRGYLEKVCKEKGVSMEEVEKLMNIPMQLPESFPTDALNNQNNTKKESKPKLAKKASKWTAV